MAGQGSRLYRRISGRRWDRARRQVLDAAGWRCESCGKAGALEVHHVRALHKGGHAYDLANLSAVCRACHIELHKRPLGPAERKWRELLREVLG